MDSQRQILLIAVIATIFSTLVMFLYTWRRSRSYDTSDTLRKLLPIIVAIFGAMVPLAAVLFNRLQTEQPIALATLTTEDRVKALEEQVKRLSGTLDAIEKQLAQPASNPTNGAQPISPVALASIDQRLTQNAEAIHKFEQLLVTDASRLVTLPLMQRDFQAIKEDVSSVKDNITGLRALLSETGSQNRWVIGTLALGMLALVVPAVKSLLMPGGKSVDTKSEQK
jgi:hypothetical protein